MALHGKRKTLYKKRFGNSETQKNYELGYRCRCGRVIHNDKSYNFEMAIYLDYLGGLLCVSNSREYNNLPHERSRQIKIDVINRV